MGLGGAAGFDAGPGAIGFGSTHGSCFGVGCGGAGGRGALVVGALGFGAVGALGGSGALGGRGTLDFGGEAGGPDCDAGEPGAIGVGSTHRSAGFVGVACGAAAVCGIGDASSGFLRCQK